MECTVVPLTATQEKVEKLVDFFELFVNETRLKLMPGFEQLNVLILMAPCGSPPNILDYADFTLSAPLGAHLGLGAFLQTKREIPITYPQGLKQNKSVKKLRKIRIATREKK